MMFGVRGEQAVTRVSGALGMPARLDDPVELPSVRSLDRTLAAIHVEVIERLADILPGFRFCGQAPPWGPGTDIFHCELNTPWGPRVIEPITMRFCYNPDEVGDSPDDAVFGVALSSRYGPSLLDMPSVCGGFGDEERDNAFDWRRDASPWQQWAAALAGRLIADRIPEMAQAELIQVTCFA